MATHRVPDGTQADDLRRLAQDVIARMPGERAGVVAVAGVTNDRPSAVVAVNAPGRALGLSARDLVRVVAGRLGGGGGGKDDIAQGGGTDVTAVDAALASVVEVVRSAAATS